MKSAILICTIALFGTSLAQNAVDPLQEARDRANAASTDFTATYSGLQTDSVYLELLKKFSDLQSSIQTKLDEAGQQIRTPYDQFNTALYTANAYGAGAECSQIATLNLYLDVSRTIDNTYQTTSTYSQIISDLQTLSYSQVSNSYYAISNRLSAGLYDENVTVEKINDLITKFEADASKLLTDAKKLYVAIDAELAKLEAKFNEENSERVQNALSKLETIKQDYQTCKSYGSYA